MMNREFKIGAAVGSGIVARAAEAGGADFLLAINAGRIRNMGMPSISCMLPIRDATEATVPFAEHEVLPQASIPVFIGLTGWSTEPEEAWIRNILDAGFVGVANFPSAMHYSRSMRRLLDRSDMGTNAEISMLRKVQAAGGRALFYCGTLEDARLAADAALDAVVFNFGWNVGGADSHTAEISLEEAAQRARGVARLVRRRRPEMEVFLEGGPILTAQDLNFVIHYADIDGYVGGSTIDRFPVQHSVTNQIAEYKSASQTIGTKAQELKDALAEAATYGLWGQSEELAQFVAALIRAREARGHIYLTAPSGSDVNAALKLLTAGRARVAIENFDFGLSRLAHLTNDILFGRAEDAMRRPGLLRTVADFVVLHNCADMPRLVLRKMRNLLRTGQAQRIGSRVPHAVQSRLIFVSDQEPPDDWTDTPLTCIRYPDLKSRHLDVRIILERYLAMITAEDRIPNIRPAAFRVLSAYDWPENDTELRRVAVALASQSAKIVYEANDIQLLIAGSVVEEKKTTASVAKRQQLLQALTRNGFRKGDTARALNISRKTLYNQMKRFDLG